MKKLLPMNPMPDGNCRTLKAQCQQCSIANLTRGGGYAATGVMEIIYEQDKVQREMD